MVWNLIVPFVYRYTRVITFPVAVVLGGIGYYIERRYRGTPTTPVPHEKSIIDERSDRQRQQELIASPYKMDSVIPTTIFVRNDPNDLKKFT
ncbi:unnamed protein product [Adineta ricciae]|uniref:Small integral membrane protein 12 n=1 Tax=Adineta ricciae TaxID=249248 RepID=A0A814VWF7_ADIRI|nr:unnamed protein product [Adineta ricciae]CAF1193694.1 unnamed protein product [Adineta ricciae]CAF1325143.1 unnamed protein product [Adineta ricciae]